MKRFLKLLIILIFAFSPVWSQNNIEDSLTSTLNVEKNGLNRLNLLLKLIEICDIKDNLKYSAKLIEEAISQQKLTKDTVQLNKLHVFIAKAYEYESFYYLKSQYFDQKKAIESLEKARNIYLTLKLWDEYGRMIGSIRDVYNKKGDSYLELQTLKNALEITTKANNKIYMAKYIYQLALFYANINDTISAISYANMGVELEKKNK